MSDRMLGNIGTASESKRVTTHGIINKITNMRAYIITSLYNAPTTANMYLKNEVQHDLYGGGWNE